MLRTVFPPSHTAGKRAPGCTARTGEVCRLEAPAAVLLAAPGTAILVTETAPGA